MGKYWYRHRCCICGQFVSWDADNATPFGDANDYEPPDPEYFCIACIKEQKTHYRKHNYLPTHWAFAKWELELAIEMGFWRAGPGGAAWGGWRKIDKPLPEDYKWQTIVGWEGNTPKGEMKWPRTKAT